MSVTATAMKIIEAKHTPATITQNCVVDQEVSEETESEDKQHLFRGITHLQKCM